MKHSILNTRALENLMNEDAIKELIDFRLEIRKECFTLKECGFSSSAYDYYKKLGLTLAPTDAEADGKRKWVRPSIVEFMWLKTLERCRKFGLEREALLVIKNGLFGVLDINLFTTTKSAIKLIDYMKPVIDKAFGEETHKMVLDYIKENGVGKVNEMLGLTLMDLMLFIGLKYRRNVGFMLSEEVKFIPFFDLLHLSVTERLDMYEDVFKMHFTYINYWDFLRQIPQMGNAPQLTKGFITGNDSNEIFNAAMEQFAKEISGTNIIYGKESYEVIKEENIASMQVNIEKTLHEFPYQNLEIIIRDDKKVSIKRTVYGKAAKK